MNKTVIVAVVLILFAAFGIWKISQIRKEQTDLGTGITSKQVESQIYDTIDQELEEAIANITDEEIENILLNQIG